MLILDEATSALDKTTEDAVMKSIYALKNMTIIIIAHKVNVLKECDSIFVIEKGEIIDRGTYPELQSRNMNIY